MHRPLVWYRWLILLGFVWLPFQSELQAAGEGSTARTPLEWPGISREAKPWTYWWWMASAVDTTNITRELKRFQAAGIGGVHIIPIYGARGSEERFISYLSPRWMEMLNHTVTEAGRLGLGVDMTTGSGWCFGGPVVTENIGTAQLVMRAYSVPEDGQLTERFEAKALHALVAFKPDVAPMNLLPELDADGLVKRSLGEGPWRVYAVSQRSSRQKVKRAAPGGEGLMLNPLSGESMPPYLAWFDTAFKDYRGGRPRAMYHDSYEYSSTWAPDLLAAFEARRGYRLQDELPAFFHDPAKDPSGDLERVARVKSDYRETIADVIAEDYTTRWINWCRSNRFLVRNEAHGSPANWLDLYALADIPETEMFHLDRSKLISKFASSAAHVKGKRLVSSESCTWLKEHFTETLADAKYLIDDLFLSGVNHMFYHGSCYSPDEAPWPGWLFYASLQMNSRNAIWRDAPALNAYVARCQAVLQSGAPDNDILLYWPIHDLWHNPTGLVQTLTVHSRGWFESQPLGRTAEVLLRSGYAFDYISDRLLVEARAGRGVVVLPGGEYRAVVVPPATRLPVPTLRRLVNLARAGATIIFQDRLPSDVPGLNDLESRQAELKRILAELQFPPAPAGLGRTRVGNGWILYGKLGPALLQAEVYPERMFHQPGLMSIRRRVPDGTYYFIANPVTNAPVNGWVPLARPAASAVIMDPMTERAGVARLRSIAGGNREVFLQLDPGESILVRCFQKVQPEGAWWPYREAEGESRTVTGKWKIEFIQGGPELPAILETSELGSWTSFPVSGVEQFGGTARYSMRFDNPGNANRWLLNLGGVAQSARVRLNGKALATLFAPPFQLEIEDLKPEGNLLEVEVTSVSANRIRDLDRRGVKWKNFYDINFVGIDYRPFDASSWPLTECGLLGPVTLRPLTTERGSN